MANLIKLKRSSTAGNNPTTSNLELGELAINTYDGNLFFKKDNGTASIVAVATLDGTQTLTNKSLTGPTISNLTVTGTLTAGGGVGTNGQILVSTGTGVQWTSGGVGASGAQGASGVQGASGSQGIQGASGSTGISGATGTVGRRGGVLYTFNSSTTDSDPGTGIFRFNSASTGSITFMYIDNTDAGGTSVTSWYDAWDDSTSSIKGQLVIQSDASVIAGEPLVFNVTGAVQAVTGYYKIPVTWVSGSLFSSGNTTVITFSRNGDAGATGISGASGIQGASGVQGASGATGTAGTNGASGVQGASGATGSQGVQGASGATGSQGVQGASGATGTAGTNGATGPSTAINATDDTTTTTLYPVFVGAAGSNQTPKVTTTKLSWNASTGAFTIVGPLYATTKSFRIPHPTKPGMSLTYGSLEGPENGVYVRGKLEGDVIELPEYWTKLVDPETITVNLTPIGYHQNLYVVKIEDNKIYVGNSNVFNKTIKCYFNVLAERSDIAKLEVEQ